MDKFSRRMLVVGVALLFAVATVNAATLYIQAAGAAKATEFEIRLKRLEAFQDSRIRKDKAVDDFLAEAKKYFAPKPE